jgi:hypothetical protein
LLLKVAQKYEKCEGCARNTIQLTVFKAQRLKKIMLMMAVYMFWPKQKAE